MNRIWIVLLCVAALGGAGYWYFKRPATAAATDKEPASSASELPTVSVVAASRQNMTKTLTLTAEFIPFQEVDVMAKVSGYVNKMNVDVGDYVKQGQTLATLDSPELHDDMTRVGATIDRTRADVQRAKDEVKRAESSYQMTHLTYSRLAGVMKTQPGLVAQQEVDDAMAKDQIAASQLAAARSALDMATEQIKVGQADQTKSQTMLDYLRVVAPFDGVVTKRYADNGTMIQAGTSSRSQAMPVVRISQNQLLRLVLPVPESAAGGVRAGSDVDIRIPSLNATLNAHVSRIADKVDTGTRTMHVEVDVPNPSGKYIPGMYAEVTLKLAASPDALVVPVEAVKTLTDGKRQVAVVDSNGVVTIRKVQTGFESPTVTEILDGVTEGELVVTGSHTQLTTGARVTPKKGGN